jgi:hypothetical protein
VAARKAELMAILDREWDQSDQNYTENEKFNWIVDYCTGSEVLSADEAKSQPDECASACEYHPHQ